MVDKTIEGDGKRLEEDETIVEGRRTFMTID